MEVFQRSQVGRLLDRLAAPPKRLITIFGPRQTGKKTIVRQALARTDLPSRYLPVDAPDRPGTLTASGRSAIGLPAPDVRDTAWLVRHWHEARLEAERCERGFVLALDGIQQIPQWSGAVKGLWDEDRARNCPLHVILLGSAPLLMQSGLSESLAGRFQPLRVTHWSYLEMSQAFNFNLQKYIYFGGYPGAADLVGSLDDWRDFILEAIIAPNIERDVLAMTRVDKPTLLKRVFELGADYSGQILAYHKMLGQLQGAGNTTTLARYLELLSKVGLIVGLQKYSGRPLQRRASSPKLNVLNPALMTVSSGYSFNEAVTDRTFWGRVVESVVGAHLFNSATSDIGLHYWREGVHEVDFVLRRGRRIIAVEVKSGRRPKSLQGIEEFERRFAPRKSLVVGSGGIPLDEFLSVPADHWFQES